MRGGVGRAPAFVLTVLFAIATVVTLVASYRQCTTVTLVSSNEKSELLREIATSWNRSASFGVRCAHIQVVRIASGSAENALARGWDLPSVPPPDVWSPAASSWTLLLRQHLVQRGARDVVPQRAPPIMQSPLVIAMPEPMARAVGWPQRHPSWSEVLALAVDPAGWGRYEKREWGQFKFGKTDPKVSTSGLHVLLGAYFAAKNRVPIEDDVDDPVVRQYVAAVERSAVYAQTAAELLCALRDADLRGESLTYLSAIALEEKQVWDYDRGVIVGGPCEERQVSAPRTPLVALYPTEGTYVADHPYVVLDAPWVTDEKRRVADEFLRHLESPAVQARFERSAFRDHLGHAGEPIRSSPWLAETGASRSIRFPEPRAIDRIQRSWEELKRP